MRNRGVGGLIRHGLDRGGDGAAVCSGAFIESIKMPFSSILFPLVPRGERKKNAALETLLTFKCLVVFFAATPKPLSLREDSPTAKHAEYATNIPSNPLFAYLSVFGG